MKVRRIVRSSWAVALVAAAWGAAGCGDAAPSPTDPAASRVHLAAALDAWKAGGAQADLSAKSPPVQVLDRDWQKGTKVTDYRIEGEGQPLGAGVQWPVELTLVNEKGKSAKKRVVYVVNDGDVVSIARQDVDF
ncbi:hypothetical protein [Planctomyces sp. SH-PL62]|uniref:hypothetical protein n=1 Tax=Planctomyces sp. SH-PL62 TaxID=1636152 RepID=UPI00078D42F0|nr:hypothetical protein [Planctomyces sp. SH-PL62]AMV38596.1 hypothetical protein VT85_14255 [Planctomyces sp. SH-PL62]